MIAGSTFARNPGKVGLNGGNRMTSPMINETIPPTVSSPCAGSLISSAKRMIPNTMNAIPAPFASRVPNAKSASRMAITPTMPGKMRPGFESSKISP